MLNVVFIRMPEAGPDPIRACSDKGERKMQRLEQAGERRKKWIRRGLQVLFFVFFSIMEYITLEAFLGGDICSIGFHYGVKNVMILMGVNLILVSLFHQQKPALLLSEIGVILLGMANYFVDSFRGYGIVYMDLYAAGTAFDVAGGYVFEFNCNLIFGLIGGLSGIVLCVLLPREKDRSFRLFSVLESVLGTAVGVGFFLWLGFGYSFWNDVNQLTWDHNIGMSKYGYLLYVTANAGEVSVQAPEGYSVERVKEILDRYQDAGQRNSVLASHSGNAKSPNLIMIMNEAFSDLSVLGVIQTNRPYLGFYDSLEENCIKGYAHSSVYGGYTANSEFEFLTGCSKAFFPGSPYLQYITEPIPTVISSIKTQERYKKAVAVHPYHPSGYNRNRVYPLLHFDEFLSLEDFLSPRKVREYVSDESDYQMIRQLYEEKEEGTSLCLFNVTMQNHGGYDSAGDFSEEPVKITNYDMQFQAEQYLSLIKESDDALEELITYFDQQEEPTIVVLFGDHQPHLPDFFYHKVMGRMPDDFSREQSMKRYLVPYLIWANYDIREARPEYLSLNYLSTWMMETAGLELTDYQRFLLDMYQHIPSISANGYYDSSGELHDWEEENPECDKWLEEYEILQYHYLFDKENRLEEYFE